MLSRLFSVAAVTALASGGVVLASGASAAAPLCLPNACAHSVVTIPGGGGGDTGGSGDTGGGTNASGPGLGCPTGLDQMVCNPGGNAPAAVRHVPTIDLVYQARDELQPPMPTIHTSPAGRTYVDIRTGLSLDPGDVAGPVARAATPDGGQTVTVTASDPTVTWSTGEGTATCGGADCGHTYQSSSANRPGGKYRISATVTWHRIDWTCQGDCDADHGSVLLPVSSPTATADLAVGEIQTESRPG